jgi:hypothetical protein
MENDRAMMVRMFLRVGQKEINFIWHISAAIGLFFGMCSNGCMVSRALALDFGLLGGIVGLIN